MIPKSLSLLLIYFALTLSGCAVPRDDADRNIGGADVPPFIVTKTFFVTDREQGTPSVDGPAYSTNRGPLSYGVSYVSIPRVHKLGELERPSMWRLEFRENQDKHIVLKNLQNLTASDFFVAVGSRIAGDANQSAFLFVHGYRVSFEDAALRTAQMAYDLGFSGAPIFYSWPSQGKLALYPADESAAEWSETNLLNVLEDFASKTTAKNIYLIGHSMGARLLSRAYSRLVQKEPALASRFSEVVLAAPDIDADVFVRDLAPAFAKAGIPVTLYASSKDEALSASKFVHKARRAGSLDGGIVLSPGVESIDASLVDTSLIGHSYYADNRSIISDLFYLTKHRIRAKQRNGLEEIVGPNGTYWAFKK